MDRKEILNSPPAKFLISVNPSGQDLFTCDTSIKWIVSHVNKPLRRKQGWIGLLS